MSNLIRIEYHGGKRVEDVRCKAGERNGQQIADNRNSASVLPNNIRIENDSLQILNIKRTDGGKYSCEILIFGEENSFKQNHLINVLFPPSVYPEPSTGDIDVELMQGFILICDVVGNPQPRIKWYFENKEMPLRNEYMTIFNVTKAVKQHAGEYRCVADNLIGKPASATFQIRILYYPEVSTEKNWVHSANGLKIELVCEVIANPRPKVDWFHNDYPVNFSSKVSTRIFGNKYFLIIKNMKFSDFGNYSCQGTNFLGRNYKTIEVSGLAHPAVFKSDPRIRTETSYTLIWEVDSYSIIIQYNLRFRKQQRGDADGHWISLIIPSGSTFQSPIQSGMYTLAGLEPGTVYEVVLSSKNEFGWSKPSKIFTFSTLSTEYKDTHQEIDVLPPTTMKSVTVENKTTSSNKSAWER
ncbi:hypothetical protein PGB90_003269 [Kerria lacca]